MKFKDLFESCLMYQNPESLQGFVHFGIEIERRAKTFLKNMEQSDFLVYEIYSQLALNFFA